jgi:hypothetical protein
VNILGQKPNWTKDDIFFLEESWGVVRTSTIAKKLKRTVSAVQQKAIRLGLGPQIRSSAYISLIDISRAFQKEYSAIVQIWINNNGLKMEQRKFVDTKSYKVIKPKDFWKWAENNKGLLNFAKYERYALPDEPEWLKDKIKSDYGAQDKSRISKPWTAAEDDSLRYMYSAGKYTLSKIAKSLNRSELAIKRRAYDLGLKKNFIRSKNKMYTLDEVNKLLDLAKQGLSLKAIAKALERCENSVRGKLERMGYNFKTCTFRELPLWVENRRIRRQQKKLQEVR